jgi:hypothetical protein
VVLYNDITNADWTRGQVISEIMNGVMEFGTSKDHLEEIEEIISMHNSATFGKARYHNGLQFNFASPVSSTEAPSLAESLGTAGSEYFHIDAGDDRAGRTAMISLSIIEATTHPGNFFLSHTGFYMRCDPFIAIVFSARDLHGGNAPVAKAQPLPHEIRITAIAYPNAAIMSSKDSVAFATVGKKDLLLPKGLAMNPGEFVPSETGHTTFSRDGVQVMAPERLNPFMVRHALGLITHIFDQNPNASSRLHIDADRFMDSIYTEDDKGQRNYNIPSWPYAPGMRGQAQRVAEYSKRWEARQKQSASLNPSSRLRKPIWMVSYKHKTSQPISPRVKESVSKEVCTSPVNICAITHDIFRSILAHIGVIAECKEEKDLWYASLRPLK